MFGGGAVAVLDDFRVLELVRDGGKETIRSRWRQDKGHRSEWATFAQQVQRQSEAPIPFDDLVSSTLATLRVDESAATGKRLEVDTPSFLGTALRSSGSSASVNAYLNG